MDGIGPLLNEVLQLSIVFAYIGVGLWAVYAIAPKPRGLGLNIFKGGRRGISGRGRGRRR